MITKENYGMEHIEKIREKHKVDRTILERSIYALGLLEALVTVTFWQFYIIRYICL